MTNEVGATELQVSMLPSFSLNVNAEFRRAPNLELTKRADGIVVCVVDVPVTALALVTDGSRA